MKKTLSSLIATLTVALSLYSQAPGIFNYQGVARNSVGNVLENKTITLRLSVHDISSGGPVVYQENRTVTTNQFGLFNIQVGSTGANNVIGTIASVNWAVGNKYLQVEIDPSGGGSFINLGTSQLASVPYALNAFGAAPIGNAGGDLSGAYPNPSVTKIRGINLSTATPGVNSVLGFDGTSWGPVSLSNPWLANGNHIYSSNSGFVGIGTRTPTANLHIKSNEYPTLLRLQGAFNNSRIEFLDTSGILRGAIGSLGNYLTLGSIRDVYVGSDSGDVNLISNRVFSMVIQKDKAIVGFNGADVRLGVGTDDPATKLHINQNYEAVRLSGINTNIGFYNGSTYKGFIGSTGNDIALGIPFVSQTGNLYFYTNGDIRMSILNNGLTRINKSDEALRLSGDDSYMSFYNGVSYKGFVGASDNDIELGTPNSNTNGKVIFYKEGIPLLTLEANTDVSNFDYVKIGTVGSKRGTPAGYPKLSVQGGPIGFKKPDGDQLGEWAIGYGADDNMGVYFNGGIKGFFANTSGAYVPLSDFRIKENFESYKPVLKDLRNLNVLTYKNKSDKTGERIFGLVAQNVQQYFPELVASSGGDNKFLGIDYSKIGVLAVKAVQEQQVIIETLEKKIEMLEKRMAMLEQRIEN